jgi:hypothetical protein
MSLAHQPNSRSRAARHPQQSGESQPQEECKREFDYSEGNRVFLRFPSAGYRKLSSSQLCQRERLSVGCRRYLQSTTSRFVFRLGWV